MVPVPYIVRYNVLNFQPAVIDNHIKVHCNKASMIHIVYFNIKFNFLAGLIYRLINHCIFTQTLYV